MDPVSIALATKLTLLNVAFLTPFIASGIAETQKHDAIIEATYPTVAATWYAPTGFDKQAELNQCLMKHGIRINAGRDNHRRYITVGQDADDRLTLTITRWPVSEGEIGSSVPVGRTKALQCVYENGKLWNARLSQFDGSWVAANLPQRP